MKKAEHERKMFPTELGEVILIHYLAVCERNEHTTSTQHATAYAQPGQLQAIAYNQRLRSGELAVVT